MKKLKLHPRPCSALFCILQFAVIFFAMPTESILYPFLLIVANGLCLYSILSMVYDEDFSNSRKIRVMIDSVFYCGFVLIVFLLERYDIFSECDIFDFIDDWKKQVMLYVGIVSVYAIISEFVILPLLKGKGRED